MGSWNEILVEIQAFPSAQDVVRRKYLASLQEKTGRNVITYYSGWLQKPGAPSILIDDEDKNGLMAAVHGLDRTLGLDLILHTPGGETAATESIVDYLRSMFGTDIRAVVPQLAMSGGTMISCACKSILMGLGSSLGPIDPQLNGIPAHGIVEEFKRAAAEIKLDNTKMAVWQPIIAKYGPTFVGECEKAIVWSNEMTAEWLSTGMFVNETDSSAKTAMINKIISELGDHALTKSHARHLSLDRCRKIGLVIEELEADQELQDAVLSVHHAYMCTFSSSTAVKIIENQEGVAFVKIQPGVGIQKAG